MTYHDPDQSDSRLIAWGCGAVLLVFTLIVAAAVVAAVARGGRP